MFYGNIVFINIGINRYPFGNSFDYKMVNFDLKLNSLELTAREFSLILPIVLTTSLFDKTEKFKKLNDYYKAVLNYEVVSSQRDLKIEQVDQ